MSRGVGIRLGIVLAWFVVLGIVGWLITTRSDPETHADIVEHYKYGSIGAEGRSGVPASLWLALPEVFPDLLPKGPGQGYERVGLLYEKGKQRPIGTSFREAEIGMVGLNCAVCHVGSLRASNDAPRQIILGMPANQFNLQAYLNFLRATGKDERFDADTLIPAIKRVDADFSRADELLYRHYVIPRTRAALRKLNDDFAWLDVRPTEGPGRVDTFNPYKVILGISTGKTVGTSDLPSLWHQRPREGMQLHWDGNNDSVAERNVSAAIGAGASADSLDTDALERVKDWILDLKAPRYPRERIDSDLAAQGAGIYAENCASCHSFKGSRVGKVTPINAIGTDRERLDSFTTELVKRQGEGNENLPKFSHFRPTATPTSRWTASGCAPRTCTTAPCRRSRTCSSRPISAPTSSTAASTSTTGSASGSSPAARPRSASASSSTRASAATATAATRTARTCPRARSVPSSST